MSPSNNDGKSLSQNLQSRNSSKSERTLLSGTPMILGAEKDKMSSQSSSQHSLAGDKSESDVEAQRSFDAPQPTRSAAEKQDPNLVKDLPNPATAKC